MGLFGREARGASGFVVVRDHVFADVDAADGGHVAAEGFCDGAGAAGVVQEADLSSRRSRCGGGGLVMFFGCGPLGAEPVFALLEG